MSDYNQEFQHKDGVLLVKLSGTFPNELLRSEGNLFQPLIDECQAHNYKLALIDARNLQVHFSTISIFRAGEDAAVLSTFGLRVAIVAREDMIDSFFEDVAFNRGGNVGVFTDMDTARIWLQK
ncbi:MAG: hypothetical protein ACWGOV_04615 [Acidiferrobacterales bacterium]